MSKIIIKDLPRDYKISSDEMMCIKGGIIISTASKPSLFEQNIEAETLEDLSINYEEIDWTYTPQKK